MVFGWFLNNVITSNPGTVKFSVRFFSTTRDTNENNKDLLKLSFSLSTKTQSITINPAISYDINNESGLPEVNTYNDLRLVVGRFEDSAYFGDETAELPVFSNMEFGGIFSEGFQEIAKVEDVDFLSESAYNDACRPGNPKETSFEDIKALYLSLM